MNPAVAAFSLVAVAILSARPLHAACDSINETEVRRIVHLELDTALIDDASAGANSSIECEDDAVELSVVHPRGRTVSRTLDLSDVEATARPRLVALALVELMSASAEPEKSEPEARAQVEAEVSKTQPKSWQLAATLGARAFSEPGPVAFGGQLSVERAMALFLHGYADVALEIGSRGIDPGDLQMFILSGAAAACANIELGAVSLCSGAGLRGGWSRLSGEPLAGTGRQAASVSGAWLGPFLSSRLRAHLSDDSDFVLRMEGGVTTLPTTGLVEGATEIAADGFWLSGALGLSYSP